MSRLHLCVVVAFCLWLPGCRRNVLAPAPPAAVPQPLTVDYLEVADRAYARGDYGQAARDYEHYLQAVPAPPHLDDILLRLAMAYAVEGSPVRDFERALQLLNEIVAHFPTGPAHDEAQLLLALDESRNQRGLEVEARDKRIAAMEADLAALTARETECRALADQLQASETRERKERDSRIRQLTTASEELQEKIRTLSIELDALKKIDMQRRPSRPPR